MNSQAFTEMQHETEREIERGIGVVRDYLRLNLPVGAVVKDANIWVLGEGGGPQPSDRDMRNDTRSFSIRMEGEKHILRVAERILRMDVAKLSRFLQEHGVAQILQAGKSVSIDIDEFGSLETEVEPL